MKRIGNKKNKNKKFFVWFFFLFLIIFFLFISNRLTKVKQTTDTKAAPLKIIEGQQANFNEWPFMVALYNRNKSKRNLFTKNISVIDGFFCGGALIDNEWVLTAAHCLFDQKYSSTLKNKENIGVALNAYDLENIYSKSTTSVIKMIPHEGFDYANQYSKLFDYRYVNDKKLNFSIRSNDIALLKIKPINVTNTTTISLSNNADLIKTKNKITMLGFGDNLENWPTHIPSKILMEGENEISSNLQRIGNYIFHLIQIKNKPFSSEGDSGSPLLTFKRGNWYAIGVTSGGGYFTNLTMQLNWIKLVTGLNSFEGTFNGEK